ncbi:hypothetical protein F4703DRAFT_1981445, partial [Phycomyces blakesleeanus]
MIFKSPLPPIQVPKTGLIQYLFNSRKFTTPENKVLFIDVETKKTLTFRQTKENILRFAAGLQDKCGFKKDDILAIYAPNQYDYIIPMLGTIVAGGTISLLNPNYNKTELECYLKMTKPKVLIAFQSNIKVALEAGEKAGILPQDIFVFGEASIEGVQPYTKYLLTDRMATLIEYTEEEAKDSVALLCLSSGTTGKTLNLKYTFYLIHTNLTTSFEQHFETYKYCLYPENHRSLGILPFYHILGLYAVLNETFYHGIPLYVLQKFDFSLFCETIQKEKITRLYLAPPIILRLSNHTALDNYNMSSLEIVHYGAAPVSKELDQKVKDRLKKPVLRQLYGLSEVGLITYVGMVANDKGIVGKLVSNMTAKIVNEEGKEVGYNESGEIWLKGPNVMKGYLNNLAATAECIDSDGYFHTGDIAVIDNDDNVYIVDRIKELIKYNGFQVPPAELEAHLLESPLVADCAVIGVYDEKKVTELPRAYVVLAPDVEASIDTEIMIMKFVADRVVAYKRLHSVFFLKEIPKTTSGKILRKKL